MHITNDENDPVRELVEVLDRLVVQDGAVVAVRSDDAGACEISANRSGYLRLGLELMKAAAAPDSEITADEGERIAVETAYLLGGKSREFQCTFRRLQEQVDLQAARSQHNFQAAVRSIVMVLLGIAGLAVAVGMVNAAMWLSGI